MARIAVVGGGISGLACADILSRTNEVMLFEAERRPGGHARTLNVDRVGGQMAVDTGFIVYNEVNYPLLTRLFAHLGVDTQPSSMSFGVRYGQGELEFCASSLGGLFAQKRNAASPRYWKMLADIMRFFARAPAVLHARSDPTLGAFLDDLRLGSWFRERFLLPMGAAIWSTPPDQMLHFPAKTFVRFFANHGLLTVNGQHAWRTVRGGSERYVERLAGRLGKRVKLGTPVERIVKASNGGHEVIMRSGDRYQADEVVLACHADRSLSLLDEPSSEQRRVLGAFTFRDNEAVLHRDRTLMPQALGAWASWVYACGGSQGSQQVSVTYWMNKLQGLPGEPLFVTLNPDRPIRDDCEVDRHVFRHPVFSRDAIAAQRNMGLIQGRDGLWFCGAWQRHGFHEDGLWSAVRIADLKGVPVSWR